MVDIIALIIIGVLLAVILLIIISSLFIPVNLYVRIDEKVNYLIKIKFLFFKFSFDNKSVNKKGKKPIKEKKSRDKKESVAIRAIKKLFGIDSFETKTKRGKQKSASENAKQIINTLKNYLSSFGGLLRKIKIKKLHIKSVSASSDAALTAMQYGVMCALLYPFLAFLQNNLNIDENSVGINVACDFENQESQFEFESEISLRMIFALTAVVNIIRKNI